MAEFDDGDPGEYHWEDVDSSFQRVGGARREQPSARIFPSGLARLNSESSALLTQVVKPTKLNPNQFSVRYRVDVKKGLVAVLPVPETEPARVGVVVSERRYSLHLGPVFLKYPELRLPGKRKCIAYIDPNTGYFTLSLKTGQAVQTQTRSG